MKLIINDEPLGFGEITELAARYGWVDTFGSIEQGNWTCNEADACEESALEFLSENDIVLLDQHTGHGCFIVNTLEEGGYYAFENWEDALEKYNLAIDEGCSSASISVTIKSTDYDGLMS